MNRLQDYTKFKVSSNSSASATSDSTATASTKTDTAANKKETSDNNLFTTSSGSYSNKFDFSNDSKDSISTDYESVINKLNQNGHDIKLDGGGYDARGIQKMLNHQRGDVTYDIDGDGVLDTVDTATAIAASFDSVLDLYIQKEVEYAVQKYGRSTDGNGFLGEDALEYLKSKNIQVNDVQSTQLKEKIWSFSLVDNDGNVMKDENEKLGSCIFADGLNADGYLDSAETKFPSILDELGYDCISRADFTGTDEEYEAMLDEIEAQIAACANGGDSPFSFSEQTLKSVFGEVKLTHRDAFDEDEDDIDDTLDNDTESIDKNLQKIYNQELESRINSYMSQHNKDSLTETELNYLESKLSAYIVHNYDYSIEDIKAARKTAHESMKQEHTASQTESTETTFDTNKELPELDLDKDKEKEKEVA